MDFRNPRAAQESSHSVQIIFKRAVQYSFVCHLSAALRREGISSFNYLEGNSPPHYSHQDPAISVVVVSNIVEANDPWSHMFIKVTTNRRPHRKGNVTTVMPPLHFYDDNLLDKRLQETGILIWHKSRISSNRILTDSELVEEIVKDVYGRLYSAERVGIYSKLLEIDSLLYKQPHDVRSIGIWGMPGIGKTTLAKAVFNHISIDYDATCFIENFDEAFHKEGLHRLLEEKLGKIVREEFDIKSSHILRQSLHCDKLCDKRILVVIDDVRDSLAADSFIGRLDWFGPGSLIIMTSVDKQVFAFCQINQIYEVQGLNEQEALQLFFMINVCGDDWLGKYHRELAKNMIEYANGNPLALSIYGRELKGKMSEMEATFLELKKCPPQKIQDALKNVYSALDDNEKNIVLDIAFFFKGENVDYVVQFLEGCRYLPRVGIDVLVDKCVLTISDNTVQMNNLFQDICQTIFSREIESSNRMLEPYSIRYLLEDDELKASGESSATPKCGVVAEDIESIILDTSNLRFDVKHDAFTNMSNLRFLKIYNSCSKEIHGLNFPKGLDSLPSGLRLLHWENYPLQSLPKGLDLDNLVELCMPYSQLQTLGAGTKNKSSGDKRGWSFRKKSGKQRGLITSVVSETTPASRTRETLESALLKSPSPDNNNVSEKQQQPFSLDEKKSQLPVVTYVAEPVDEKKTHSVEVKTELSVEEQVDHKTELPPVLVESKGTETEEDDLTGKELQGPNVADASVIEKDITSEVEIARKVEKEESETDDVIIIRKESDEKVDEKLDESAIVIIQAAIRGFLGRRELLRHKKVVKLQAAVRGHLVRSQAMGSLRCVQAIVKMQAMVRARHSTKDGSRVSAISDKAETNAAAQKLLENKFAKHLMESTPKTKPINIKCDPTKPSSAWNWLERWMSVPEPKKTLKADLATEEQQLEETQNVKVSPQVDFVNSDSTVGTKTETGVSSYEASKPEAQHVELSETEKMSQYDSPEASAEVNHGLIQSKEPDSSLPEEPEYVDEQPKHSLKRKSSNPSFIAAQSKFEELTSSTGSNKAMMLSSKDGVLGEEGKTDIDPSEANSATTKKDHTVEDTRGSQLQTLGAGRKNLKMLKRIRLCHSQQLVKFDLPLNAQNIEIIDLQGCTRLRNFPDTSQLQHLRIVNLSGCTEIKGFHGAPPNIEELYLQGTSIRELPISILCRSPQKDKLDRQKLLNLLESFQDVEHIDLEIVTDLVKVSSYNQGFGKLVHLNMKDCFHLKSLPNMVNLESLQVLHLTGCSELKEITGFPRNMRKLYLGGTAIVEVPQLPKNLEFLNAHGCTYLKSVCLDFEQLPRHYTFSNCFNFPSQVIAEFLGKGLTRIASLARAHQQEVIKAPEVSICIPAGARQRSSFLLREGPNVKKNLSHSTRRAGFAMSVVVSFPDDYHNTVGLGIRCICAWQDRFEPFDKIERIFQCWAPGEAPKVKWEHIFIFYDTQMHPNGTEVEFEFHTVSWENERLGAHCRVIQCDVQVITASTDDTSLSEITRESEAKSIIEEHPPSSSRVLEPQSPSFTSSKSPKVSRASNKLSSKGTMLWKWVGRLRLARAIRSNKKKTLRDREGNDLNVSTK